MLFFSSVKLLGWNFLPVSQNRPDVTSGAEMRAILARRAGWRLDQNVGFRVGRL